MPIIDADTHILECDDTFAYLQDNERQFAPINGEIPARTGRRAGVLARQPPVDGPRRQGRRRHLESDGRAPGRPCIQHTVEDNLLIGSDFIHNDHATELNFMGALQARVAQGDLSEVALRKVTYDNPRAFYGL